MSKLTLFITPKDFDREHIATIQWNAIKSWTMFRPDVDVILIGDDHGVAEAAESLGVHHIPTVKRNASGTPMLNDIFQIAYDESDSPLLAYVNADIILLPNFVETAVKIAQKEKTFLLVGQRWDLDVQKRLDFSEGWSDRLYTEVKQRGRRHPAGGSDYFIYPRSIFQSIPAFAIGRSGWDNWMFYAARKNGWKLINCTNEIDIVHQDHDYAHLPEGKAHYRQPESAENVKAAGGRQNIFTLMDCDWTAQENGTLKKPKLSKKKILREIEIFPLIKLQSGNLQTALYDGMHPRQLAAKLRGKGKTL